MSQTKISVWGSCVSRDIFNSDFIADYKEEFELIHEQQHVSVISLMSSPYFKEVEELNGEVTNFYKNVFRRDLSKAYLNELKANPPEYLIVDFYTDTFYGSVEEISGTFITNKLWQYKKLDYFSSLGLGKELSVFKNSHEYIEKWKIYFDRFMYFMNKNCLNTEIIINKSRFVDKYWDEPEQSFKSISDKKEDRWKAFHIDRFNIIWNLFDTYAVEKYNLKSIDFDLTEYYGDIDHKWGLFYVHYNQKFYNDLFQSLVDIVKESKKI
ncbi:DUF6270 domain-containing protein [Vagococcus hydrophili]|uniref:Uncharacterized protein n=1 Tax=Vagococcus hydrophili TaxID=2714947 RepID=A0A6G8AQP4_9ENTE|nr:DUF6270 domain-containing protein [Vagococcus hydrophili]QIL47391.1 hypothetical protein G7082_02010 [Vagococcus hydrophili]